ncbi:MAG: hypothetical protein V5A22_06520 [Salinivenus sp.]
MVPFSLVYFEGQWLDDEAVLIEGAAERVETAFFPEWDSEQDAPWVAVAHDAGASGTYIASRKGNLDVMVADSPEALARKIRSVDPLSSRVGL